MQLYVGNLDYNVTEDDLKTAFSEFGEVVSAVIIKDRETQRSKGFGFVEMPNQKEAEEAVEKLNNSKLNGRNIEVNQARPRTEKPRMGGGGNFSSRGGGDRRSSSYNR